MPVPPLRPLSPIHLKIDERSVPIPQARPQLSRESTQLPSESLAQRHTDSKRPRLSVIREEQSERFGLPNRATQEEPLMRSSSQHPTNLCSEAVSVMTDPDNPDGALDDEFVIIEAAPEEEIVVEGIPIAYTHDDKTGREPACAEFADDEDSVLAGESIISGHEVDATPNETGATGSSIPVPAVLPESITEAINLTYRYDAQDMEELLSLALSDSIATEAVTVFPAVNRKDTLRHAIVEWLDKHSGDDPSDTGACLLVVPFSQRPCKGLPSEHWTCVLLGLCERGRFELAFLDPRQSQSQVQKALASLVMECDPDRALSCVSVSHFTQPDLDLDSCGPYVVCEVVECAEHFIDQGHLPIKLNRACSPLELRTEHFMLAGGLGSRFAQSQSQVGRQLPTEDYEAMAEIRSQLREQFYDLIYDANEDKRQALAALSYDQSNARDSDEQDKALMRLTGLSLTQEPRLLRWARDFFNDTAAIARLQQQLMAALQSVNHVFPRYLDMLSEKWRHEGDALSVVREVRATLKRLVDEDDSQWQLPECKAFCELATALLSGFVPSQDMTSEQIDETAVCDLGVLEWALAKRHEIDDDVMALYR